MATAVAAVTHACRLAFFCHDEQETRVFAVVGFLMRPDDATCFVTRRRRLFFVFLRPSPAALPMVISLVHAIRGDAHAKIIILPTPFPPADRDQSDLRAR